jgi:hypothetical protein
MECDLDHESSLWDKLNIVSVKSCPGVLDDPDDMYCCVNDVRVYCCNSAQFLHNR